MLTHTSALRRTVAALSAAGALTTVGLAPAAAHDRVISVSPEEGAVLEAAPEEIELSFTGEIMDIGHQVRVTDSEGQPVTEGPLEQNGTTVSQPLAETSSQDETYQVVWRVVSSDGHPIEGTYTYEVGDGADTTTPAPGISSTPTEAPADSSDNSAQAQDAAAQEDSGWLSGWVVGVAAVVLALAVVGLLGLVSRRRRRS